MNRWDFDCQECEKNIGDAWYVDAEWYQCSQDRGKYSKLKQVFLEHLMSCGGVEYDESGKIIAGKLPKDIRVLKALQEAISRYCTIQEETTRICGKFYIYLDLEKRKAWWSSKYH